MMDQAVRLVYTSEIRSLKANMERRAGLTRPAPSRYEIKSETLFVDAPLEKAVDYMMDLENVKACPDLLRHVNDLGPTSAEFLDEYDQRVRLSVRKFDFKSYTLVEYEYVYEAHGSTQHSFTMLMPCSHAFCVPEARGIIKHQAIFWPAGARRAPRSSPSSHSMAK